MTAKCSRYAPTAAKVAKVIEAEGWTANHPRPEDVIAKWRPLSRAQAQSDPAIIRGVTSQKWTGLAVKDFGEQKGMHKCLMSTLKSLKNEYKNNNNIMNSTLMTKCSNIIPVTHVYLLK